jgi:hypothetical protein
MSHTDDMRTLAVVSTQLTYESFIVGDGRVSAEPTLPEPLVAVDLVADNADSGSPCMSAGQ